MNWASFIGACALAAAAGSLASDRILAEGAGGVMSDRVQIELRGSITPRCAFQNIASSLDLGAIPDSGVSGEKKLDFQISCNAPFAYGLSSEDGAMRRDAGAEGAGISSRNFPIGPRSPSSWMTARALQRLARARNWALFRASVSGSRASGPRSIAPPP